MALWAVLAPYVKYPLSPIVSSAGGPGELLVSTSSYRAAPLNLGVLAPEEEEGLGLIDCDH